MHVDEYLTYGLANNEFNGTNKISSLQYGVKLAAADVYDDFFYPDGFSIRNVWLNQAYDVHPPLYYLIFHIFTLITHHFLGLKTGVLLQIMIHAINIGLIWLIIFIPCVLYLLTITKIAIMSATRYISPSYAICVILLMGLFDKIVSSLTERDWVKWIAGVLMVAIMLNNGYKIYTWTELHMEAKECVENARKYGINNDCIYVFASSGFIYPAYQEFIQYQNMTFIRGNDLELLYTDDYSGYDHVVMYFDEHVGQEKIDGILDKMIEMNPGLDGYEMLHKYSYNMAYYLD